MKVQGVCVQPSRKTNKGLCLFADGVREIHGDEIKACKYVFYGTIRRRIRDYYLCIKKDLRKDGSSRTKDRSPMPMSLVYILILVATIRKCPTTFCTFFCRRCGYWDY